jgi:hypothetical protein
MVEQNEPPLDVSQNASYLNIFVPKNLRFLRMRQQSCVDTKQPSEKINRKLV